MKRRKFIKNTLATAAASSVAGKVMAGNDHGLQVKSSSSDKILNAYYFRAHMYTMVPRQVREDMHWMADKGTNVVSVAVLEQDLWAGVKNIEIICNEAAKVCIEVHAVPSRWGGIVAGAPKVPSLFTITHPQTYVLEKNGTPKESSVSGRISSIHYPETLEFVQSTILKCIELWDIKGVIWDEPKTFGIDYSPMALKRLGPNPTEEQQVNANVDFYTSVNKAIKEKYPDFITGMFLQADKSDLRAYGAAKTGYMDYYGCDGRPWRNEDGGKQESSGKVLLGAGERFLEAARQNNKKTLWLAENHNMLDADAKLMDKRMPEILEKDVDQLIYYYYPRNLQSPDMIMDIMAKYIKKFR